MYFWVVYKEAQIRVATNSENGPNMNTEYIRFWKFSEYQILNYSFFENGPNTNSTIWSLLFKYQILNTKYGNWPNSCCQKYFFILTDLWQNEKRKFWFFIFVPKLKIFTEFFIHFLLYKDSKTIRYLVITIWVFEYYSVITNRPNTNSTIRS